MKHRFLFTLLQRSVTLLLVVGLPRATIAATPRVTIDWANTLLVSRSTPTLQVVVNPPLRRGSTIHDPVFAALKSLGAERVRYVPWLPYPRLAVAELEPPSDTKTSWDFSQIDPMTIDFFDATQGHATVLNFSTIPAWLFKTPNPVGYPADPNQVAWNYTQGTELRDPTLNQLGDYYARLVSWYTQGGFTDERGVRHTSGYRYPIAWWEVLNETEAEHSTTPQQYTERYDAIVTAIHKVSPETKFMGLAMAYADKLDYYRYFLDKKNHKPNVPVDAISYHFYANTPEGTAADDPNAWNFCEQADAFFKTVHKIEDIRRRLNPQVQTDTDELGVIASDDGKFKAPPIYWNAVAALFAYEYIELGKLGIETIGASQLVGYPTQFPSVSMVNWTTGKPNARFRVLELLKNNFGPGDAIVATQIDSPDVSAQAYHTSAGQKVLLINKRNVPVDVMLPPDLADTKMNVVDLATGEGLSASRTVSGKQVTLSPYAVAVLSN